MRRKNLIRLAAVLAVLAVTAAIFVGTASAAGPSAVDDTLTLEGGENAVVNVLANDTDADDDDLEITWVTSGVQNGAQVECDYNGDCRYYADTAATYPYQDQFDYEISDNQGGSDVGKVTVTVNDPNPVQAQDFVRTVSLQLNGHLNATGSVSGTDIPDACTDGVAVEIQRKIGDDFETVEETTTANDGTFEVVLDDDPGTYRAVLTELAIETPAPGSSCSAATSSTVSHKHPRDWARTVTLNLSKHLKAAGKVDTVAANGPAACFTNVTVTVQRKKTGKKGWSKVGTDATNGQGAYNVTLPDKTGRYRAKVGTKPINVPVAGSECSSDTSGVKRHSH